MYLREDDAVEGGTRRRRQAAQVGEQGKRHRQPPQTDATDRRRR